jgi:hypothetical protein
LKGNAFKRLSVPQKRTSILEIALDLHQQRPARQQGFHRMTVPRANMPCTFSCGARSGDFVTKLPARCEWPVPPTHHEPLPGIIAQETESRVIDRLNKFFATVSPRKQTSMGRDVMSALGH